MQLPTYLYLVKRFDKNALVGGFYLQNIISEETEVENITKDLRLKGFTTSNRNIISLLDESFDKSNLIYGMSTTKDGEFSKNAKILSEEEITNLDKLTEEKIKEATKNILEGNYQINPKEIDNNLVGCTYCTFKDICFMKKEDAVKLKKVDYKEFLKGDNND